LAAARKAHLLRKEGGREGGREEGKVKEVPSKASIIHFGLRSEFSLYMYRQVGGKRTEQDRTICLRCTYPQRRSAAAEARPGVFMLLLLMSRRMGGKGGRLVWVLPGTQENLE